MQLSLFDQTDQTDKALQNCIDWFRNAKFDIRKREFEEDEAYHQRVLMTAYAFSVNYSSSKWVSIEEWVEICPKGKATRLPIEKKKLAAHICHYLEMKDIKIEDWSVPKGVITKDAQELPRRATYIARPGDVFLSRFKEPLGKSVVYLGKPEPLYVNSNYFLLRARNNISPLMVLAILKSTFLACQLHHLIRPRSVITEMFQYEIPRIRVPNLSKDLEEKIVKLTSKRIDAENKLRTNSNNELAKIKINYVQRVIDDSIKIFIEQT